jgi:retron-type reverse transcriptase
MTSIEFMSSFPTSIDKNSKILAENSKVLNWKCIHPLVGREKIKDFDNWIEILNEAKLIVDSLLTKVWAVGLVSTAEGSLIPGADHECFLTPPRLTKCKNNASKYLYEWTKKLKYEINLSQGLTNQVIQRKGSRNLNTRETYRRYLKSFKGKLYIKKCKEQYRVVLKDPLEYLSELRLFVLKNNIRLKFKLLKILKRFNPNKYFADPILRVLVPKANNKLRQLAIITLKDRALQTLFKLVMESYMEPLGDKNSFGFRPGRNCHQAISHLSQRLSICKSNILPNEITLFKVKSIFRMAAKIFKNTDKCSDRTIKCITGEVITKTPVLNHKIQKLLIREKKWCDVPYYLLDVDIEACLDKISHEWLFVNVPMPLKYESFLKKILTCDVVEKNKVVVKREKNNYGVFQSGVLSFLLMNWTLDGIENLVYNTVVSIKSENLTYYDFGTYECLKKRYPEISEFFYKKLVELKYTSWSVRYADDFIVGIKGELPLKQVQYQLRLFLEVRGLNLLGEKTKIIKWSSNNKINFLSWTCHYLVPKRVSWIIKKVKCKAGRLNDWAGVYVYPSKNSVSALKFRIKQITNHQNSWRTEEVITQNVANLVVGWSNYFSPAPGQGSLRLAIDWYVFQRMKRYVFKKYGNSHFKNDLTLNLNKDGGIKKVTCNLFFKNARKKNLVIPRLYDLNAPVMWSKLAPKQELCNFSYLINPTPYLERALQIIKLKQDLKSKLFCIHEKFCCLCNQQLVNWENLLSVDSSDIFMDSLNQTNVGLFEVTVNNYESYINFVAMNPNLDSKFDINYQISSNRKLLNNIVTLKLASFVSCKINFFWAALDIAYIIPIKLAGKIRSLKYLLSGIQNLRLVHRSCSKNKTFNFEEQQLLKHYSMTWNSLISVNTKLSMITEKELNKLHVTTVLKLDKDQRFEYLYQLDDQTIKKLFKIYVFQVEKLASSDLFN